MPESVLTVPFWLELAAALTGGVSGAMAAVRARYDLFGTVVIACTAGLFGGVMRDILLQDYGIYAFQKPTLIVCCVIAAIIVFYFGKAAGKLDPIYSVLDNLSMGLWAVISVGKGLSAGLEIVPSIVLGTTTAVGGGIMRDVFMNKQPEAFQAGTFYGTAALAGSTVFAFMDANHFLEDWAPFICVGLVLVIRYLSLLFGWKTGKPRDYTDVVTTTVAKPVKLVARKVRPPKGKVQREKERDELSRFHKMLRHRSNKNSGGTLYHDPSDRIRIVSRDDIRSTASGNGPHASGNADAPAAKDPFAPQTPDPKNSPSSSDIEK